MSDRLDPLNKEIDMPPSGHSYAARLAYVTKAKSNFSDLVMETEIDKKYPSFRVGAETELRNLKALQASPTPLEGPDRGFVQCAIDDYEMLLSKLDENGDDAAKAIDSALIEIEHRAAALHVPG